MNLNVFNLALLLGWLLVLIGGCLWHPAAGLAVAGLLLIILTIYVARLAGGVYSSKKSEGEG
jgi:heme A synthase